MEAPKAATLQAAAPKSNEKESEVVQPVANVRASNAQWKPAPQKERWGVWGRSSVRMSGANDTPLGRQQSTGPHSARRRRHPRARSD